uniref:Uncharacterized protein n=1 Tax=Eutreptiella gymnastica TaxID=73025 RepID=A0A7S4GIN6_9EUGL
MNATGFQMNVTKEFGVGCGRRLQTESREGRITLCAKHLHASIHWALTCFTQGCTCKYLCVLHPTKKRPTWQEVHCPPTPASQQSSSTCRNFSARPNLWILCPKLEMDKRC